VATTIPTLEFPGVSYPGRRKVTEIFNELKRQTKAYADYVVSTKNMAVQRHDAYGLVLAFSVDGHIRQLPMSHRAWLQLAQWLGLRTDSRLYKRLRYGYEKPKATKSDRFWDSWLRLINDHFQIVSSRRLIRTLARPDGAWYVRAIMSNSYRIIPNDQLFLHAADKIQEAGAEVWDARLSEDRFYLYCVAPGISAQIRSDRPFKDSAWKGDAGDAVNAALMLANSETGQGGCDVKPGIVTAVTGAYMVGQTTLSLRHLGARHDTDSLLSEATIHKENELVFAQIKDFIDAAFNEDRFQLFVDKMQDATQDELDDPMQAAQALRIVYDMSEAREKEITKWLLRSGDNSRLGLARAVCHEAQSNDRLNADEAALLEQLGGELVEKQTALSLARAYEAKSKRRATKAAGAAVAVERELAAAMADDIDM